jgi:hypothetical protein
VAETVRCDVFRITEAVGNGRDKVRREVELADEAVGGVRDEEVADAVE